VEAAARLMPTLALFTKSPSLFLLALLVFGVAPVVVAKVAALSYPPDDERRAEILGELAALNVWQRPMWAAEQGARAFTEGLPARWRTRKLRRQQVLDRRYYDALRQEALLREAERADFQQALHDLRALTSDACAPAAAGRRGRHAAPSARRRAALLPAFLLAMAGIAFGGLAMLPVAAPPADRVTPQVGVAGESAAAVVVALVLILLWGLVFAQSWEHIRRSKPTRTARVRRARSIPVHQRP
jgi:hypothetical protein